MVTVVHIQIRSLPFQVTFLTFILHGNGSQIPLPRGLGLDFAHFMPRSVFALNVVRYGALPTWYPGCYHES